MEHACVPLVGRCDAHDESLGGGAALLSQVRVHLAPAARIVRNFFIKKLQETSEISRRTTSSCTSFQSSGQEKLCPPFKDLIILDLDRRHEDEEDDPRTGDVHEGDVNRRSEEQGAVDLTLCSRCRTCSWTRTRSFLRSTTSFSSPSLSRDFRHQNEEQRAFLAIRGHTRTRCNAIPLCSQPGGRIYSRGERPSGRPRGSGPSGAR